MHYTPLLAALLLVGCAPAVPVPVSDDHPASAEAPTLYADTEALPPAPQPELPAPLRTDGQPPEGSPFGAPSPAETMNHRQVDHDQMDHKAAPDALTTTLDAYLAIQEALAADQFAGVPARAEVLSAALTALVATPPHDSPHFWHERIAETDALQTHARALAEASDLASARAAFGELSLPFVTLIDATGTPAGYDLAQYTCGMTDAPAGGVWIQRSGSTMNPYFGASMLACGSRDAVLPTAPIHDGEGHDDH